MSDLLTSAKHPRLHTTNPPPRDSSCSTYLYLTYNCHGEMENGKWSVIKHAPYKIFTEQRSEAFQYQSVLLLPRCQGLASVLNFQQV